MTAIEYAKYKDYFETPDVNVDKELFGIYDGYKYTAFDTEEARDSFYRDYKGSFKITKFSLGYIGSFMHKDNIIKFTKEDINKSYFVSVQKRDESLWYNEEKGTWDKNHTYLDNLPEKIKEIKNNKLAKVKKIKAI